MEYIICFKTKDINQFEMIKDARYTAFEITDEIKDKLNENPEEYKKYFKEIINK